MEASLDRDEAGGDEAPPIELSGENSLEALSCFASVKELREFSNGFLKLYRALRVSSENEQELLKQCSLLRTKLVDKSKALAAAVHLKQLDQSTIANLRKEVAVAERARQLAREKEEEAQSIIQRLADEVRSLQIQVHQLSDGLEGAQEKLSMRGRTKFPVDKKSVKLPQNKLKKQPSFLLWKAGHNIWSGQGEERRPQTAGMFSTRPSYLGRTPLMAATGLPTLQPRKK